MSSSDSYYINILNQIIVIIYRYGNIIIYILGSVGNVLRVFIFLKRSWRKNVCVFYFLICLLLNFIYLNSTILASIFNIGFNINLQNSNVILCKLTYYLGFLIAVLLPTVLILASIDRLLISSQNVDTRLYSSKRLAYFSISISTLFWIVFNLHLLITVNLLEISPSVFVCSFTLSKIYISFVYYSLMIFNCLFCLLMIILSVLSFKNVRRIRSIPRQQRNGIRVMTKKDFQLLRCLFVHDVVLISLSVVPSLYSVYQIATKDEIRTSLEQAIINFLNNLFTFVYFTFFCSNFFIFLSVSKAFRHEVTQIIYKILGKQEVVIREEDNKQKNIEQMIDVVN